LSAVEQKYAARSLKLDVKKILAVILHQDRGTEELTVVVLMLYEDTAIF
jgi:hypothetical protein